MTTASNETRRAANLAARVSYGRLLAYLAARTHDIAAAEDALSNAFIKALDHWPHHGVPQNPDAWLLTTARNKLTDQQRHQTRFPTQTEIPDMPDRSDKKTSNTALPDERLSLLMVCAHPAIAPDLHVPLMLQTVLGLEAKTIAQLFLISPTALTKRLGRAKAKIKAAGIPFQIPDQDTLPERSHAILEAIYALHAHDWLDPSDDLGDEALYLADILCQFLPDNAEVLGISALISLSHARRPARLQNATLIPTDQQDVRLWNRDLIRYGTRQLARASQLSTLGRFQLEAAIEAVHTARQETGKTDWDALHKLYFALQKIAPSAGGAVAHAALQGRLFGAEIGLHALEEIERETGTAFQPLWAARADLYMKTNLHEKAIESFKKAISLSTDTASINLLKSRLSSVKDARSHRG